METTVFMQEMTKWWTMLKPALDFCLIAATIYSILYFLRGTRAANILVGIGLMLFMMTLLTLLLDLSVIGWLMSNLWTVLAVSMVVVFQPELRRAFAQVGSQIGVHRRIEQKEAIEETVSAVMRMSECKCGALIIFERKVGMAAIINSSVQLDVKINSLIVQSIFYPNSPLHDGAVIVREGKIVAAHAILPLTHELPALMSNIGTRHRAAIGVTEEIDAVAVVVSEETGWISVAYRGRLIRHLSETDLLCFLKKMLIDQNQASAIYERFSDIDMQKTIAFQQKIAEDETNG